MAPCDFFCLAGVTMIVILEFAVCVCVLLAPLVFHNLISFWITFWSLWYPLQYFWIIWIYFSIIVTLLLHYLDDLGTIWGHCGTIWVTCRPPWAPCGSLGALQGGSGVPRGSLGAPQGSSGVPPGGARGGKGGSQASFGMPFGCFLSPKCGPSSKKHEKVPKYTPKLNFCLPNFWETRGEKCIRRG